MRFNIRLIADSIILMKQKNTFYIDVLLFGAGLLSVSLILVDVIYYIAGWDYFAMSGLAKLVLTATIIPAGIAFWIARKILSKKGFTTVMEMLVHFVVIAAATGFLYSCYWYTFDTKIDPNYRFELAEYYYKGLEKNSSEVQDMGKKKLFLEKMQEVRKDTDKMKATPPNFVSMLNLSVVRFMAAAFFYGLIYGFIFSKIYVSPNENSGSNPSQTQDVK